MLSQNYPCDFMMCSMSTIGVIAVFDISSYAVASSIANDIMCLHVD